MKTIGISCRRRVSSRWRSGPDMPGMAMSRIRHWSGRRNPDARNSSADENACDRKAKLPQQVGQRLAHGLVVIDDRHERTDRPSRLSSSIDTCRDRRAPDGWRAPGASLGPRGNGKRERRARAVIRRRPEAAMMALDDGAADGQADAHAVALGGVERVEELVRLLCGSKPTPASCTVRRTRSPSSASVLITSCLGRSSTPLIASEAFRSRFRMTC